MRSIWANPKAALALARVAGPAVRTAVGTLRVFGDLRGDDAFLDPVQQRHALDEHEAGGLHRQVGPLDRQRLRAGVRPGRTHAAQLRPDLHRLLPRP